MKFVRHKKWTAFYIIYAAMTLGCLFSEYRFFAVQVWYCITAAVWSVLVIKAAVCLIKLTKVKRLRTERRKP